MRVLSNPAYGATWFARNSLKFSTKTTIFHRFKISKIPYHYPVIAQKIVTGMKYRVTFTFFFLTCFAVYAEAHLPKYEFRAVWVATVANIDWPSKPGLSTGEQQQEVLAILDMQRQL